MAEISKDLAVSVFSEVIALDHLTRASIAKVLPRGMELSHFSVLNHLAQSNEERTPAQLAKTFHVTRGAMTNTIQKLKWAGWVHIRPDWDDARRKLVAISPAGMAARDAALAAIAPVISGVVDKVGDGKVRDALPVLRALRQQMNAQD